MYKMLFLLALIGFCGCSSSSDEDEVLITQPVTNNPLIVPNHNSGLGGIIPSPGVGNAGSAR